MRVCDCVVGGGGEGLLVMGIARVMTGGPGSHLPDHHFSNLELWKGHDPPTCGVTQRAPYIGRHGGFHKQRAQIWLLRIVILEIASEGSSELVNGYPVLCRWMLFRMLIGGS